MTAPDCEGLPTRRRYLSILVIMLANSGVVLDAAAVNMVLPRLSSDFAISPTDATIVVTFYQIIVISCVLPLSALGEIAGFRRVYLFGITLFSIGALICAMSDDFTTLLCARAIQSLGAACVMSMWVALIRTTVPSSRLGGAIGANATVIAASAALGPLLAGAVLSVSSWHAIFLVGVPFTVVAGILGLMVLPGNETPAEHRYDVLGAVLAALAFGCTFGALAGATHANPLRTTLLLIVGVSCFGYLFIRLRGATNPILPLDLLSTPVIAASVGASVCCFAVEMLCLVSLPFIFQNRYHIDVATAGMLFGLWPLMLGLMAPLMGLLTDRVRLGPIGIVGMLLLAIALALMAALPEGATAWQIGPNLVLCGMGIGLFLTPNNRIVISSAPRSRTGSIGGVLATARLSGQTLGTSLAAYSLAVGSPLLALKMGCGFAILAAGLTAFRSAQSVAR